MTQLNRDRQSHLSRVCNVRETTSYKVLEKATRDPYSTTRRTAAANHAMTYDLLLVTLFDEDASVSMATVRNPGMTPDLFQMALTSPHECVRLFAQKSLTSV